MHLFVLGNDKYVLGRNTHRINLSTADTVEYY